MRSNFNTCQQLTENDGGTNTEHNTAITGITGLELTHWNGYGNQALAYIKSRDSDAT